MVRVISVHHFSRQDVSVVPAAPTAVAAAGSVQVAIATEEQTVFVRDLNGVNGRGADESHCEHSFQTIDVVRQLLYCPTGRYLATLEGGTAPAGVRVYVNWSVPAAGRAPICPRIAGCVSPSYAAGGSADVEGEDAERVRLDVIEFPQRDTPLQIAVCSTTGNLMVAAANLLVIYKYTNKVSSNGSRDGKNGGRSYVDFHECIHVFHNLVPREIALSEDVVACLTNTELHVFKILMKAVEGDDDDDERHLHSISLYSVNSTDLDSSGNSSSGFTHQPWSANSSNAGASIEAEEADLVGAVANGKKVLATVRNVSLRRLQDSESGVGDQTIHLDGYQGNVRCHPNCVDLVTAPDSIPFIHLPEVEEANRSGRLAKRSLMPSSSPGGAGDLMDCRLGPATGVTETAVKCIMAQSPASPASPREDFEMECVTLLHCSLREVEARKGERLRNLHLKPTFWREYRVRKNLRSTEAFAPGANPAAQMPHPLQSSLHPHLMSLTLVFCTQLEGHLYHIPGHLRKPGKGCGVHKVANYPFTSSVLEIALEPTMLHALTETGLESYTLKSGYSTVREAEKLDGRTNACPPCGGGSGFGNDDDDDDNPVCLVGLRPFLGAKKLQVTQSHLVLLSEPDATIAGGDGEAGDSEQRPRETEWTMYALTLPTSSEVNRDMLQLASLNRASSPQGYFHLLCEAHMVLRTALRQLSWQEAVGTNGAKEKFSQTKEKYLETCHLLGIHYALSSQPSKWPLAVPYFRISGRPAVSCLHSCLEEHFRGSAGSGADPDDDASLPPGVVAYMEELVLRPAVPSENVLEAGLADAIIDLLGRHSSQTLAKLVLRSRGLREFKTRKTRKLLLDAAAKTDSPSAAILLAISLQSLDDAEARAEIRQLLIRMRSSSQAALASILIEHHSLLFDGRPSGFSDRVEASAFSDLALLLQECIPETFAEILVSLIQGKQLSLGPLLSLFLSTLASLSSLNSDEVSHQRINSANANLQLFLETFFTEFLSEMYPAKQSEPGAVREDEEDEFQEALLTLVRFGEKNIDADMFGNRLLCLDKLPPFQESAKEVLDAESPEFWCQNSLLKLQSLLSCPTLSTPAVKETVCHYLDKVSMTMTVVGELSLRLLCSRSPSEAVTLLCSSAHPSVLLCYAKESVGAASSGDARPPFGEQHWRLALHTLQERLAGSSQSGGDHPLHEAWYSAQQELLEHLAQTLTLAEFVRVLPAKGGDDEFQGYIQMCRKNQQANDIHKLIVSTGQKLLATINL